MAIVAATSTPARRRILVVDDDPRCRTAVARLLAEEGYDATVAADGEEACGLLSSWHPDLVVIVLSAHADARAAAGTDGFFPKPIQVESLLARIRDLVGH
jgi:DNA-binding response OmpR family regulator